MPGAPQRSICQSYRWFGAVTVSDDLATVAFVTLRCCLLALGGDVTGEPDFGAELVPLLTIAGKPGNQGNDRDNRSPFVQRIIQQTGIGVAS